MPGNTALDPQVTFQEQTTRRALTITWWIMAALPLPLCVWALPGWAAFGVYLLLLCPGVMPIRKREPQESALFHCTMGGVLMVVALSAKFSLITMPLFFVLMVLYLVYWQLERRLFAIRHSLQDYTYEPMDEAEQQALGQELLSNAFKKSVLPAVATLACCAGFIPWGICGGILGLAFILIHFGMKKKLEILDKGTFVTKRDNS